MANNKSIQILRGAETFDPSNINEQLLDGQPFYSKKNKQLYIGDLSKKDNEGNLITTPVGAANLVPGDGDYSIVQLADTTEFSYNLVNPASPNNGVEYENGAFETRSVNFGNYNHNSAPNSIVGGIGNIIEKTIRGRSFITGMYNHSTSVTYTDVHGKEVKEGETGQDVLISGLQNYNEASRVVISGDGNKVLAGSYDSVVSGNHNVINQNAFSVAVFGEYNTVNTACENAIVAGEHNIVDSPQQAVFGMYSDSNPDALLKIGNGSSNKNRKNAFEVLKTGDLIIDGSLKFNGSLYSKGNTNNGNSSAIFGSGNVNESSYNLISGTENTISRNNVIAFGHKNVITSSNSLVGGTNNKATRSASITVGENGENNGYASIQAGFTNKNSGNQSLVIGTRNKNTQPDAIIGGAYNLDREGILLALGNGENDKERSNAFEVLQDGRAKVQTAPIEDDDVVRLIDFNSILSNCYLTDNLQYTQESPDGINFTKYVSESDPASFSTGSSTIYLRIDMKVDENSNLYLSITGPSTYTQTCNLIADRSQNYSLTTATKLNKLSSIYLSPKHKTIKFSKSVHDKGLQKHSYINGVTQPMNSITINYTAFEVNGIYSWFISSINIECYGDNPISFEKVSLSYLDKTKTVSKEAILPIITPELEKDTGLYASYDITIDEDNSYYFNSNVFSK